MLAILLQPLFARVEKILLIAFGAGQPAGTNGEDFEPRLKSRGSDFLDGFFMQRRIADDAAGADVFPWQLELRFDEDEQVRAGFRNDRCRQQNLAGGNERNINDDESDRFGNILGTQFPRVAFYANDAIVLAQFPGQLIDVDIHCIDA